MKYYQELTILPDPDINMYFIWQKLYTQLHIALAELKNTYGLDNVGVSFPNYKYEQKEGGKEFATLGNKLRIFAPTEDTLEKLDINKWLARLTDYVHIKSIQAVPDAELIGYLIVSRYRYTSLEKQVTNYLDLSKQRGREVSESEAIEHCKKYKKVGRQNYPFINLQSIDTKQNFKLTFKQVLVNDAKEGSFNTYAINTANSKHTVPHW